MIRKMIFTSLLLGMISFTLWSMIDTHKKLGIASSNSANQTDAFMEEVVATVMNKQGTPALKVISPKMIHHPENNTTDIVKPTVTVFRQSPEPWYINSDSAKATAGLGQIVFQDHVVIHHATDLAEPNTTMLTDALTVFPNKHTAETNLAVTITQPDATVHAVGMTANMDEGTVQLLSQAQAEYVPNP